MIADRIRMELCMGSSCFARGNSSVLVAVEDFIEENDLSDRVELVGHLCVGDCKEGPHVTIGDRRYSCLSSDRVIELLRAILEV